MAKLFSHLLYTDALPWTVLEEIRVNDTDTTSSSRIFIKILCQELSENMGLVKLRERFQDPYMAPIFRYADCEYQYLHVCILCSICAYLLLCTSMHMHDAYTHTA